MDFNNQDAKELVEVIRNIAQQEIDNATDNIEYSYFGIVSASHSNITYDVTVPSDGSVYPNLYNKTGTSLYVGDAVIVHARNNNFGNAYIAIKNGYTENTGGGTPDPYTLPVATDYSLGGVKSGNDITVNSDGSVFVNDNSHNHTTNNITGLQDVIDNISLKSVPSGGNTNQVLVKKSNDNYDMQWVNNEVSYTLPIATDSVLGGIKSGTDIAVDASGNVSVNDNSHNHTIQNITNLESTLSSKADLSQLNIVNDKTLPNGGTTGQVLVKKSDTDYDSEWVNQPDNSQNTFGTIQQGSERIIATQSNDILNLIAGSNISLIYDQNTKSIKISSTGSNTGDNYYGSALYWNYNESTAFWNT